MNGRDPATGHAPLEKVRQAQNPRESRPKTDELGVCKRERDGGGMPLRERGEDVHGDVDEEEDAEVYLRAAVWLKRPGYRCCCYC